jgi:molecular chaperone GrpE
MTDRPKASSPPGVAHAVGVQTADEGEEGASAARKPSSAPPGHGPDRGSTSEPPSGPAPGAAQANADGPVAPGTSAAEPDDLAKARQSAERNREQLLRVAADYDNFRKRTARDLEDARRRGRQAAVRELLPVFDNLERATNVGQVVDGDALRDGLRLVHRQFLDALKKLGIERIDPTGAPFDPTQHESIHLIESTEHAAGTIVSVVQPGYRMGTELLRPAMVVVSKGPAAAADEESASQDRDGGAEDLLGVGQGDEPISSGGESGVGGASSEEGTGSR